MKTTNALDLTARLATAIVYAFAYPKDVYGDIPREHTAVGLLRQAMCACEGVCAECATDYGSLARGGSGRWGDEHSAVEPDGAGNWRAKRAG